MFAVKFYNQKEEGRSDELNRTIGGVISYIFNKVGNNSTKVISDDSTVEIISGQENIPHSDKIVVELLIKKTIVINNEDLEDRSKLDRHLNVIRNFCDQARNVEDVRYLPINMRTKEVIKQKEKEK